MFPLIKMRDDPKVSGTKACEKLMRGPDTLRYHSHIMGYRKYSHIMGYRK